MKFVIYTQVRENSNAMNIAAAKEDLQCAIERLDDSLNALLRVSGTEVECIQLEKIIAVLYQQLDTLG